MESITSMLKWLHKREKAQDSKRFEGTCQNNQIWLVGFSANSPHDAKENKPGLTGAFIACVKSIFFNTSARGRDNRLMATSNDQTQQHGATLSYLWTQK